MVVYWRSPEYPVRSAAGMNGPKWNSAPGGAHVTNKVAEVSPANTPTARPRGSTGGRINGVSHHFELNTGVLAFLV